MTDARRTPANDRVVAARLKQSYPDLVSVDGTTMTVIAPVVDLLRRPDGPRDRQLLLGADVTVYEDRNGWAYVQSAADDYVGYVSRAALAERDAPATHMVCTAATHAYRDANMKSPDLCGLSFGARVRVLGQTDRFAETDQGFIPAHHLRPLDTYSADPVTVAELFLGTPYLWGGNSRSGIDCSGLVQAAMLASGIDCPGDSDQQEQELGEPLPLGNTSVPADLRRGDILFWKGHVAMMRDSETMIHANAYHMAVALEPVTGAVSRIMEQGDGPITGHRRLPLTTG